MARSGQGRLVTAVNGAVALALVVLLAVVALVVKPPSPPGIAEFAPQAAKPITKAPPGQAAAHGTGLGTCATGQTCAPPPSAAPVPTAVATVDDKQGVPSALQCYEWPDGKVTQTFDPQSPPCIASWPEADKGNGGATTRGVTRSEIRVTISKGALQGLDFEPYARRVVAFINSHYQLYGRRLTLTVNNGATAQNPSVAHATAQAALSTEAFAAVLGSDDDPVVGHELAQNKMLALAPGSADGYTGTASGLASDAPYLWSYEPPGDVTQQNMAEFVCTSLKGKPARFAPEHAAQQRKFVINNQYVPNGPRAVDPGVLQRGLRACGLSVPVVTIRKDDVWQQDSQGLQEAGRLKSENVTTVLVLAPCCNQVLEYHAQRAGWHPEWVFYGKDGQYHHTADTQGHNAAPVNRLGLAPTNKVIPLAEEPYNRVAPDRYTMLDRATYRSLQLLAAGLQMAGPHLTPETFADALHSTDFPNPGAAASPFYQAAVAFPDGEPWAIHDYAVWWTDTSKAPRPGSPNYDLCFVDRGRRWSLGTWTDIESKIKGGLRGC